MQHLTLERLAALVDEPAGADERIHLDQCERCSGELAGLRHQTAALQGLADPETSPMLWTRVEAGLRAEGLMARDAAPRGSNVLRAAAAVALFVAGGAAGSLVSAPGPGAAADPPANAIEAAARLRLAEAEYLRAVGEYADHTEADGALDPLNRLAALEGILLTTRAALRESPADPVINNYHLTALGLRDALMREIEQADGEQWY